MAHSKITRDKALKLWLEGNSYPVVASKMEIDKMTVFGWSKKYDWSNVKKKLEKKSQDKIIENFADLSKKQTKLHYKAIENALNSLDDFSKRELLEIIKIYTSIPKTIRQEIHSQNINVDIQLAKLLDATRTGEGYE
ncbi:MAG: hypothetical protein IH948_00735 [Bacteroidetes bacterium]|nr:hypothetical protein [Bacteroidota bacterium]